MATPPRFDYPVQPPKDFKATMDYKNNNIKKFQDDKQEGMRLMSSGRDAVLITTSFYKNGIFKKMTDEEIKEKVLMWRKWFYIEIYGQNEEFYKNNNSPF